MNPNETPTWLRNVTVLTSLNLQIEEFCHTKKNCMMHRCANLSITLFSPYAIIYRIECIEHQRLLSFVSWCKLLFIIVSGLWIINTLESLVHHSNQTTSFIDSVQIYLWLIVLIIFYYTTSSLSNMESKAVLGLLFFWLYVCVINIT